MEQPKLNNYLRAYRKRSGLSQHEVANILGLKSSSVVSHYEWSHYPPPLRTAFAMEVLFRVPVAQLFAGIRQTIEKEMEEQLQKLESELQNESGKGSTAAFTAKKLVWIMERKIG